MTWQSVPARFLEQVVRAPARPLWLGVVVAVGFLVGEVAAVFALKQVAPENAFGALLLLGVLVVSAGWGFGLSIATSLASAAVYAYLHLEGRDSLAPALTIFLTLAFLTNALVGQARLRAAEAEQRRREADLSADLARVMLRAPALGPALEHAGRRLADVLGLPFARLSAGPGEAGAGELAIALLDGSEQTGTLFVPDDIAAGSVRRVHRMVPALQALLASACDRESITAELEASRRELERFFAVASDLLFIGDARRLTRVNPAFERALGYSSDELTARAFTAFIHPDDRDATAAALAALPHSDGAIQFENRCLRRDGAVRWLEWNVVFDHGALLGGARDVTERKEEQDRLRVARRQQAALRRVATLVARGAAPADVYGVAVAELAHSLDVDHVTLVDFDGDEAVVRGALNEGPHPGWTVGERFRLDGDSISARVRRTGGAARIDDYRPLQGEIAGRLRGLGIRSGAGAPLVVGGVVRGALIAGSSVPYAIPEAAEAHIGDFADLIGTAVANAETRAALAASRARLVAAADEARRGFERDLHDGAQQRIVSLSLQLREAEAAAGEDAGLRAELSNVVDGLAGLHSDLQELSRGLHPAVLSRGGLRPAMRNLARRALVPVELEVDVDGRLPESVEVAAYYVVAEALTNVAKYAGADSVTVEVRLEESLDGGALLRLSVTDDGAGGASVGGGSGLVGLRDRVEALSGQLSVVSRPGEGTRVSATIPVTPATSA